MVPCTEALCSLEMQSVQENDSLISVLVVVVVMKPWSCADLGRSRSDLWGGEEMCSCTPSRRPQFHHGAALSHHASPTGASVSFAGHRILKDTCWKNPQEVLMPEDAWNIV